MLTQSGAAVRVIGLNNFSNWQSTHGIRQYLQYFTGFDYYIFGHLSGC